MDWDAEDAAWFRSSDYHLVLFVGDLASRLQDGQAVARSIAGLGRPALVMPGNHDGVGLPLLAAEVLGSDRWSDRLSPSIAPRLERLEQALSPVPLGGFAVHRFAAGPRPFAVISARPHSLGGRRCSFRRHLAHRFGVASLADSAARLRALVDGVAGEEVIFLAHNGPAGLGCRPQDIWGCDFRPERGDFGDPDLRDAVEYAMGRCKRVVAVVAGHMHHHLRGGGVRRWHVVRDGVHYVNAARVPRRLGRGRWRRRHHVMLSFDSRRVWIRERWVGSSAGSCCPSPVAGSG